MNNTLLLHIGMPKTGTSALQRFLFVNSVKLQTYGWSYPILDSENIGIVEALAEGQMGNGRTMYGEGISCTIKPEWDKELEIALKHLKNKNVIISAEEISVNEMDKFIAGVKERYSNVKVVIYLRRQDREIESIYNESIKSAGEYNTFKEFISSEISYRRWVDYLTKLDSISQIIGKENLIVRVYEKQQLVGNDTVTDFLYVLGMLSNKDEWERGVSANPSLGGNYLEIGRQINSVKEVDSFFGEKEDWLNDWYTRVDFHDVCIGLSRVFNDEKGERGFFTADERKQFLEKFVADNEQIAREYLHREDGVLFYDTRMDYPMHMIGQSSSFEADMIRVFTTMLYVQNRRLSNLFERKCRHLAGKLLMKDVLLKCGNRKPVLFGAGNNCQKLLDTIEDNSIALIVDNDRAKQGTVLHGVQVEYAGNIADWHEYYVIVTCAKTDDIEKQLYDLKLKKEEDYILIREYDL